MTVDKIRYECLLLSCSFETLWAYYLQSDGNLFSDECRESARDFLEVYTSLSESDKTLADPGALMLGEKTDIDDIIQRFSHWANSEDRFPWDDARMSRMMFFGFLTGVKNLLWKSCNLSRWPKTILSSKEFEHSENIIMWKAHLPPAGLRGSVDTHIQEASSSLTITLVGDIRRSQELMTYSIKPEDFSKRMVTFLNKTRALIKKFNGIFDKFTGDGFVAYFNKAICGADDKDFRKCFLWFLLQEHKFASSHFAEWEKTIRKLPDSQVGLALGCDIGIVKFNNIDNHLVVVGDSIVWASRMAAESNAGEIIMNNLLSRELEGYKGLIFADRDGVTKTGEKFRAKVVSFHEEDLYKTIVTQDD